MTDRAFRSIPLLYAIWALPLLLALSWLTPSWQNPDEPAHLERALQVAHAGVLGKRLTPGTAGGTIASGIEEAFAPFQATVVFRTDHRVSAAAEAQSANVHWGSRRWTDFSNTAQYPPFFYVPAAIALRICEAGRVSVDQSLWWARLANGLVTVALVVLALGYSRRTRMLLLSLAMMPMTLSLFVSASQDALIIGCSFLAIGMIDGIVDSGRDATWFEAATVSTLLALVAVARPPYVAFALLGLLLARRRRSMAFGAAAVICLLTIVWTIVEITYVTVPLNHTDPQAQARAILTHPVESVGIFVTTWMKDFSRLAEELVGRLGWLDAPLVHWYSAVGYASVGLALLSAMGTGRVRDGWAVWLGVTGAVCAICLAEWLDWTPLGSTEIAGLQGRYFTVVVAVLGLGLPIVPPMSRIVRPLSLLMAAVVALLTPLALVQTLVLRYFLT